MDHDLSQPRLTPEQRDRVLGLAARLQAEHESTIAVDELARAAAESGIEARFVHEAALALSRPPKPAPKWRGPVLALALLVVQAVLTMANEY